ncbi:hypothetical protein HCUR_00240 [Holospora curviuscula]|uniref:Tc1-like transposase DDE domain-containing protein n=1 Tax=Holospora curviuscula TaxID=1082868 RepID=A0A2S5REF0_9PROT|nr:hypothetical protein HCUR_00240 [Holospora curviuscula]
MLNQSARISWLRASVLPPYSFDLNPTEKVRVTMKRWIKCNITQYTALYNTLLQLFELLSSS